MDFIFEDDADEVGSDIEAYCPKCKADTAHTVISKYEEEIRKVQCSPCGDVHAYRKPRGEVEDDIPLPDAAKRRAQAKKPTWQEAMNRAGSKAIGRARPYSIRDHYHEGDIVSHPKFGVGFVTEISENKAEVTFQDERRVLVHNRPDLAAQMPAIAQIPPPREEKVKGKRGKKATMETPPAPVVAAKGKRPEPKPEPKQPPVVLEKEKKVAQVKAARAMAAVTKKAAASKSKAAGKPAAKPAAKAASKPAAKAKARMRAGARPAKASKPHKPIKAAKKVKAR